MSTWWRMTFATTVGMTLAAAVAMTFATAVGMTFATAVGAQEALVADGAGGAPLREAVSAGITSSIAASWGVPREAVRVRPQGDLPESVDSLTLAEGTGDRWIVTLWSGRSRIRRFMRAGVVVDVEVASRDLPRDHEVREPDVTVRTVVRWGAPRAEPTPSVAGWVTQRRVPAGERLVEPAVRPPLMVEGGEPVEAVFTGAGLILSIRAKALSSGRRGERVYVRLPSGRRLAGTAVGPHKVELLTGHVP